MKVPIRKVTSVRLDMDKSGIYQWMATGSDV